MADAHIDLLSKQERIQNKGASTPKAVGLTVTTAVLFITGEMTGSGVLALPHAVSKSSWFGIFLIFFCAGVSSFTGTVLGRCWNMLISNVDAVDRHCADPYPTIGYYAFGRVGKIIVNISVYFTLFGVCVVLLLIAAENIQNLLLEVDITFSFCYMVVIIGAALAPFCWLKSPKDFWPIALMATVTTAVACVLIVIQTVIDIPKARNASAEHALLVKNGTADEVNVTFGGFFLAFGMILFCFGGMAAFPTIQADMKQPKKFPLTVCIAMIAILLMYVPVGSVGYGVYGNLVEGNIFKSLTHGPLLTVANILITIHLISAYVILQNPLSQVFEIVFNVRDEFSWKRALIRTLITVVVIFTALSCPKFGHILSLVGGSAVTLNTFVFPSVFYLKLCQTHRNNWREARISPVEKPFHFIIILIGVIGGISSTYTAVMGIIDPKAFVPPCYMTSFALSTGGGGGGGH